MTTEAAAQAKPLAGRHAVVTGGGRGIGASVAASLASLGATITVMGRSADVLEEVAGPIGGHAVVVDVAERGSVERGFADAVERAGPVQILVNNAGMVESAPFAKTSEELWQRTLRVNLDGVFHCSQAVVPGMVEARWGRIVNIASTSGLTGYAYVSAYCAAKHGVVGLTRSLAIELVRRNITVNAICPGYVETDLLARSIDNIVDKTGMSAGDAAEQLRRVNPQHRFVQPGEVARAVEWLCLPGSESMTGQALALAGGEIL